jgi:two-component system nitrogen regulation response regulator NtrX
MQIKRRILVVDDEPNICSTIKEILEEESLDVEVAYSGAEAREKFYANPHDLILLDVWMPDVDGISLLRELSEKIVDTVFIMMSGHATVDTAIQATKLGAKAFLEKPIALQLLLDTVRYHLEFEGVENNPLEGSVELPVSLIGKEVATLEFQKNLLHNLSHKQTCVIIGHIFFEWNAFRKYLRKKLEPLYCFEVSEYALNSSLESIVNILPKQDEIKDNQALILELSSSTLEKHNDDVDHMLTLAKENYEKVVIIIRCNDPMELDKIQIRVGQSACALKIVTVPTLKEQAKDIPEKTTYYLNMRSTEMDISLKSLSSAQVNTLINHEWTKDYYEFKIALEHYLVSNNLSVAEIRSDMLNDLINLDQRVLTTKFKNAREQFEYVYLSMQLKDFDGKVSEMANHIGVERTYLYRKLKSLSIKYN